MTTKIVHERFSEINEERFDLHCEGVLVGYAVTITKGRKVWVMDVWVHPEHRGHGYARQLLGAVIARYPGRVLVLTPTPFEWAEHEGPVRGLSASELEAWYSRSGFRRDGGDRMIRECP